jgi:prevent-host-death family protein
MKEKTYSLYDAKARFSEVIRNVEMKRKVIITKRGRPVAEIVPFSGGNETLEEYVRRKEEEGIVQRSSGEPRPFGPVKKIPGLLDAFLEERNRGF